MDKVKNYKSVDIVIRMEMKMKIGIMQPYFLPYIGYFSLIEYSDRFIFFDTPQYIHHGWVNRNRVLKHDGTPNYISVPLEKAARETAINDMVIRDEDWVEKIFAQLVCYKKKAPYYKRTIEFLHSLLDVDYERSLSKLNIETTKAICEYIGLNRSFDTFSEMNLDIGQVNEPDEWALNITKAVGGDIYVNPPGGLSFFNKEKYQNEGIELQFLKHNLTPYVQRIGRFEPGLSIIDVLMFNEEKDVTKMLADYEIIIP
jgi:hypothetical protein